jgi:hypothetical protein
MIFNPEQEPILITYLRGAGVAGDTSTRIFPLIPDWSYEPHGVQLYRARAGVLPLTHSHNIQMSTVGLSRQVRRTARITSSIFTHPYIWR